MHTLTSRPKQHSNLGKTNALRAPKRELHPRFGASALPSRAPMASSQRLARSEVAQRRQDLAALHRAYGNQAVLRMSDRSRPAHTFATLQARSGILQPKLTINQPSDEYEREADRVAEGVMRMPDPVQADKPVGQIASAPSLRRKCSCGGSDTECAGCKEEREGMLQHAPKGPTPIRNIPPIVYEVLRSPGQLLDPAVQAFFEPRFGQDFSSVRVHTGTTAADSARAISALAYTVGKDVVFGTGQYAPGNLEGNRLLAHELTHVVQQGAALDPGSLGENLHGRPASAIQGRVGRSMIQRDVGSDDYNQGYQDGLKGADWHGAPRDGDALTDYNEGYAKGHSEFTQGSSSPAAIPTIPPPNQTPASPDQTPVPGLGQGPSPAPTAPSEQPVVPGPLLEALRRSFDRRLLGVSGSEKNLDNAFWAGRPTDFAEALDRLGNGGWLSGIQEIFSRWTASGIPWSYLQDLAGAWAGTTKGFRFNPVDIGSFRQQLEASSNYCRDNELTGGFYHFMLGETPCWREVVSCAPGLHFCLGSDPPSVHIDPTQVVCQPGSDCLRFVIGASPLTGEPLFSGTCVYDFSCVYGHFKDLHWVP